MPVKVTRSPESTVKSTVEENNDSFSTKNVSTCGKGSAATAAGEATLMVGLAQGGDDLAFHIRAALRALGAVGAVIALRAEEVPLPARKGGRNRNSL